MTYEEIAENIRKNEYEVKNGQSKRDFYDDLVAAFQLDPNTSLTKRIYSKAWENGHSAGYHEVLIHFHDLVEVYKGE